MFDILRAGQRRHAASHTTTQSPLDRQLTKSDHRGIPAQLGPRLERMLDRLDACVKAADMDVPGLRFHPLKGERAGEFAMSVSGNWRITFGFDSGDAIDVHLEDYH